MGHGWHRVIKLNQCLTASFLLAFDCSKVSWYDTRTQFHAIRRYLGTCALLWPLRSTKNGMTELGQQLEEAMLWPSNPTPVELLVNIRREGWYQEGKCFWNLSSMWHQGLSLLSKRFRVLLVLYMFIFFFYFQSGWSY